MKKFIISIIIFFYSISSCGLQIHANLDDLIEEADLICTGKIISGEVLERGAKYSFKVDEVLKGKLNTDQISFGKYYGKKIGSKYLLLLKKTDIKNHYTVFFEGMTTFEIEYEIIDDEFQNCVEISEDIISLSKNLKKEKITSRRGKLWDSYYYKYEDILNYIKEKLK